MIESDWAKLKGLTLAQIFSVAIMACTAKKDELARQQLAAKGYRETDLVITTRELIRLIRKRKINFAWLAEAQFDSCYSIGSAAGAIFCRSGGIMEAAVRSAYNRVTGKQLAPLELPALRGAKDGIKVVTADFDGTKVGVAVAQGIANAMKLIARIRAKEPDLAAVKFVEVMACPGGSGAPKAKTKKVVGACYKIDKTSIYRTSHDNPEIIELYARFGGKFGCHVAREYVHTHYDARKTWSKSEPAIPPLLLSHSDGPDEEIVPSWS